MNFHLGAVLFLLALVAPMTLASPHYLDVIARTDNNAHLYEEAKWHDLEFSTHPNATEGATHRRWEDITFPDKYKIYKTQYACLDGGQTIKKSIVMGFAKRACTELVKNSRLSVPIGAGWEAFRIFNQMDPKDEKTSITYRFRGDDVRGEHTATDPELKEDLCAEIMERLAGNNAICTEGKDGITHGATIKFSLIKNKRDDKKEIPGLEFGFDPDRQKENVWADVLGGEDTCST